MSSHRLRMRAENHHTAPRVVQSLRAQHAEQLYFLAVRFYESKHYAKALRLMEYLLRIEKPQAKILRTTGMILQADEQFERALDFYARALKHDDQNDPLITLGMAQSLVYLKRFNEAWPYLEQTQERLKHPSIAPQLRNQLVQIFVPLMDRVQQLNTSIK